MTTYNFNQDQVFLEQTHFKTSETDHNLAEVEAEVARDRRSLQSGNLKNIKLSKYLACRCNIF